MPITSEETIPMIETGDDKAKAIAREFLEQIMAIESIYPEEFLKFGIRHIFVKIIRKHGIKVDE